jgi:molybdopterin converting factor small subunit
MTTIRRSSKMQVKFLNQAGGGFNSTEEVAEGTTMAEFFRMKMRGEDPAKYNTRINQVTWDRGGEVVLQDGDLVSIIPGKFDGGGFGAGFLENIKAATELGRLARENPSLKEDLAAISDLGAAIKATPDLAKNLEAVIEFVRAIRVLDGPPDAGIGIGSYRPKDVNLGKVVGEARVVEEARPIESGEPGLDTALVDHRNASPVLPTVVLRSGVERAAKVTLADGETIGQFFARMRPGHGPIDYRIEVNASTVDADTRLKPNDVVVIVPIATAKAALAKGAPSIS